MPTNRMYKVIAECGNCGNTPKEETPAGIVIGPLEYKIPIGTVARVFLSSQVCPNCGCADFLERKFS